MATTIYLPHVKAASLAPVVVTGQWRKLIMANYVVDPTLVAPYLPAGTSLNLWNGKCYMTLTAFTFEDVRVRGVRVPFLHRANEVNFQFYIVPEGAGQDRRGVAFVQEITEKPLLAWGANLFYKEHYRILPVEHSWNIPRRKPHQRIQYTWQEDGFEYYMKVKAGRRALRVVSGTEEHFLMTQPFGFSGRGADASSHYGIEHPAWDMYEVLKYKINVDFEASFGKQFAFLNTETPHSVYLVEGSDVAIRARQRL